MFFPSVRRRLLAVMLISSFVLGSALIYQNFWNQDLAVFCLSQKLILVTFIILGFLGGICGCFPRLLSVVIAALGLLGGWLTFEQFGLQQTPQEMMPGCLPPLSHLIDILPLTELMNTVFSINGECAGIHSTIVGISLPAWSLGLFILISVSGGRGAFGKRKT